MPRRTPPGRVRDIARAACEVFTEKGYRRTLMTDVAARLELNHALLYRYVESKEALLELAVRYAIDPGADLAVELGIDLTAGTPLATPPPGHTVELLSTGFNGRFPALRSALAADRAADPAADPAAGQGTGPEVSPGADAVAELAAIIDEFYGFVQDNQRLLALTESLVVDYPELNAEEARGRKREHLGRLAAFLDSRIAVGGLRPVPDTGIAAVFIVESVAWFAWHRKGDPDGAAIDDDRARQAVRELLLAAFVPNAEFIPEAEGGGR
jgi:AcrR family transcriptional regulator